jgi:cell wall-associated NlpC family hydrolase
MALNRLKFLPLGAIGLALSLQSCSSTGGTGNASDSCPRAQEDSRGQDDSRGQVVMAALSQIGTKYRYGAQSPGKALDCSALAQYAYRAAGVRIPRVSTDQRKSSTPVIPSKLQPGDLVFFRIRPGVHHVGLMVDDKRFVHASPSKKKVRLSCIDSDYWQSRLIGAGTYLNWTKPDGVRQSHTECSRSCRR